MDQIHENRKNRILRIAIQAALILIVLLLIFVAVNSVLPGVIEVLARGEEGDIQAFLGNFHGAGGYAIAFFLQFIQIITIFLPSIPIQVAVGIIFGVWRGFLVCFFGYVLASALIFVAARKLGTKLEKLLPTKKIDNSKKNFILDSEYPAFMVLLATLFPIIPNGIIPYVAAKTKISFGSFILAIGFGCIPTILTLCAVGKHLIRGNFITAALFTLPLIIIFALLFWQQKRIIALYERLMSRLNKRANDESEK